PKPWASAGITIANNCSYPVWPGIQSSPKYPVVARGGFFLPPNTEQWVDFPAIWSGSIWGRLGCNFDVAGRGKCVTGDCGNGLYCNGLSGAPPATIVSLAIQDDQQYYNVSFVNGYNVPITIKSFTGPDDSKCGIVGCTKDLNTVCPAALQVRSMDYKSVVACKSPCGNAKTCGPNQYSKIFKKYCPKAYTYTFDKTPSSVVPCANVVPKPWASAGLTIANNCSYPVWPGIQSSPQYPVVARGGFFLPPNSEQWIGFSDLWSGRIWGRLGCNFDAAGRGKCITGDCGSGLYCNKLSCVPPVTIVSLSIQDDQQYYNVSFVNGYNVPITIKSFTGPDDSKCGIVGCTKDLNTVCPAALQVRSADNKSVVACNSPCENAKTCGPNKYSRLFKKYCPKAYTYTFDKTPSSVVPCANVGYVITFCPKNK
ncbi:uncharacterized protein LOC124831449, partial [Vigna umbellata]|uniref:uncharacterized protein LOC124831449 n=1 Tax=Vigna umbellata TaxID=87088 RepID=UPI001F5FB41E